MKNTFLLKTKEAVALYETYAKNLPIIDFHNHINVQDLKNDRVYKNLTELWVASDPYKHRLMRICGVEENLITGNASDYEKFEAFCAIFPLLAGNPVYDWSRMELKFLFDIDVAICKENAKWIFDKTSELLKGSDYTNNAILKRFNIEYQSPVAQILDDLSYFDGESVAPSLRGDNLLQPTPELKKGLAKATGKKVDTLEDYISAVCDMLDRFNNAGCKFADHALDAGFFDGDSERVKILTLLGVEYAKRGWTLLLHLDAKRKTSQRLLELAGPAGGYACVGGNFNLSAVCDLLGDMEKSGGLPDTVLFPLNMSDQAPLAVMQGSFSQDSVASKVQLGPAWWWCDHELGITNTLKAISNFGVLSQFIGMTTDSRSVLSFIRHDYFRRIVCSYLAEQNKENEWELPLETLGATVEKICYRNALNKLKK